MKQYDYFWMADVKGLHLLSDDIPSGQEFHAIKLMNNANPQRRPTYGTVTLYPDVARYIQKIIRIGGDEILKTFQSGMKDAWKLIGGTKEDKIPIIITMLDTGPQERKVAEMIMEGFDFRLAKGISNGQLIIENYADNFDNPMVQQT